jgi:alpha-N-arabinofuranosidase
MVFEPQQAGEEAGLVVLRDKDHYFRFTIARDKDGTFLQLIRRDIVLGADSLIRRIPISHQRIHLRVSITGSSYSFHYGRSGIRMKSFCQGVDGSFLGAAAAGRFTGTMVGMYASSNGGTSLNKTRFDWMSH